MASARKTGSSEPALSLGERLAALRRERAITLERLAEVTGFTKGYLSKIENAKKVPPIGTLARLAAALDVDIGHFFQPRPAESASRARVSVVHVQDRQPTVRGGTAFGYDYASLAHRRRDKRMEPFFFSFPRRIERNVHFRHEGEEFLFILSGRVEFEVDGEKYLLEAGDCMYFDADLPHRGRALGGSAKAIVVTWAPRKARAR
jgi:transcriptional regulator with XRE-family HTH domain